VIHSALTAIGNQLPLLGGITASQTKKTPVNMPASSPSTLVNLGGKAMKITPPENIRAYVEDESRVPLVSIKNVLWYSITQEEKESLAEFLNAVDSVPEAVWRAWDEAETLEIAALGNNASRILRNSVIRSE